MRIIDRYILKEIAVPTIIAYFGLTMIFVALFLVKQLDLVVNAGVSGWLVGRFLMLTIPYQSVIAIPMAFLLGILLAFGRLSQDSEIIALRASGVSVFRMFLPVFGLAFIPFSINLWLYVSFVPECNLTMMKMRADFLSAPVGTQLKERVFAELGPYMIYPHEVSNDRKFLTNLFVYSDTRDVILARRGETLNDGEKLVFRLSDGVRHSKTDNPLKYHIDRFKTVDLDLTQTMAMTIRVSRSAWTQTVKELQETIKKKMEQGGIKMAAPFQLELYKRFAIPFACLIFAIIGVPLGITNRRGGKSSGFAIAVGIFTLYYMLLAMGQGLGSRNSIPPAISAWIPNFLIFPIGLWLLWRMNAEKHSPWLTRAWEKMLDGAERVGRRLSETASRWKRRKAGATALTPRMTMKLGLFRTLDRYIILEYLKAFGMVLAVLMVISFLTNLSERIDDMIDNKASVYQTVMFFVYRDFYWTYFSIQFAALVATIFTLGGIYKNSEMSAMQAAGLSVWRITSPLLVVGLFMGVGTFFYQDYVLPRTNRAAEQILEDLRDNKAGSEKYEPNTWLKGANNTFYHFLFYNPSKDTMNDFFMLEFGGTLIPKRQIDARFLEWKGDHWLGSKVRETLYGPEGEVVSDKAFDTYPLHIREAPKHFKRHAKNPEEMSYVELREYIHRIEKSGYDATRLVVDLYSKLSLSCLSLVMILIGIPFSYVEPRQGTVMRGIGMSLIIGALYYLSMRFFIEFGHGDRLPPLVAAWAANVLFVVYGLIRFWRMPT